MVVNGSATLVATMAEPRFEPLHAYREDPADGLCRRARTFLNDIGPRRIVRDSSSDAEVPGDRQSRG